MSTSNQISLEIPAAVIAKALKALQESKAALAPYLRALSDDEKKSLFKMGDKTIATVKKVKSYIETNPEFVPAYMDKAEFLKDEQLAAQLSPLSSLAEQLASDLDDTVVLAGSDAISSALLYYGQVKEAYAKGVPASKPIYEDLSQRFARKGSKSI
ncbi:hypothetical protein GCM10022289_35640 [Pedobacter jeongneungensis]|uniref:Uncharacterized protein n=1 Tax=Pedobacter jeongneungensis TaxID=947309 RepID=A0ABP8BLC1_9SPHI